MSILAFKSSDSAKLRRRHMKMKPPKELSEDIANQTYDYFHLTGKCVVFGVLLGRDFLVTHIDCDHKL